MNLVSLPTTIPLDVFDAAHKRIQTIAGLADYDDVMNYGSSVEDINGMYATEQFIKVGGHMEKRDVIVHTFAGYEIVFHKAQGSHDPKSFAVFADIDDVAGMNTTNHRLGIAVKAVLSVHLESPH